MTQCCLKEAKLSQGSHAHHASRRELLGLMGVPGEKQGAPPGNPRSTDGQDSNGAKDTVFEFCEQATTRGK